MDKGSCLNPADCDRTTTAVTDIGDNPESVQPDEPVEVIETSVEEAEPSWSYA